MKKYAEIWNHRWITEGVAMKRYNIASTLLAIAVFLGPLILVIPESSEAGNRYLHCCCRSISPHSESGGRRRICLGNSASSYLANR